MMEDMAGKNVGPKPSMDDFSDVSVVMYNFTSHHSTPDVLLFISLLLIKNKYIHILHISEKNKIILDIVT